MNIASVDIRFWSKVDIGTPNNCWEWQACADSTGYGRFLLEGINVLAHRVAWELAFGPIPKGEGFHGTCVCHKCDNRKCCNPNHLFLGAQKDNVHDCIAKGRKAIARGENHRGAKLSESQIVQIRKDYIPHKKSCAKLALEYNVAESNMSAIVRRITWVHI